MKYCMKCGKPVSETAAFCGECGADLTITCSSQQEVSEAQPSFQSPSVMHQPITPPTVSEASPHSVSQSAMQPPVTQAQPYDLYNQTSAANQPNAAANNQYAANPKPLNGLGIAGFVLSILSLILSLIPIVGLLGLITLIPGFLLSLTGFIIGLVKKKNILFAIVGMILSLVALGLIFAITYVIADTVGSYINNF